MRHLLTFVCLLFSLALYSLLSVASHTRFADEVAAGGSAAALLVLLLTATVAGVVLFIPVTALYSLLRQRLQTPWRQPLLLTAFGVPWLYLAGKLQQVYAVDASLPLAALAVALLGAAAWVNEGVWRRQEEARATPVAKVVQASVALFAAGLLLSQLQAAALAGPALGMAGTLGLLYAAWRHYRNHGG